jgi:hypothetical protein
LDRSRPGTIFVRCVAWALEKGYATDGDDASLRRVAASAVPIVEEHLAMLKALQPLQ